MNGNFFRFLEVDIHVPDHLQPLFEEMPPLVCNTHIHYDDIDPYMQHNFQGHALSKKPLRLLISGMKASKILLSPPTSSGY